ncbi:efflux RND transporter periplasmic adaptor subunit [Andreprevotia chitinilytica]|uniref:efflux RND transporter periplasmic adaptor subunit n=1 Tax=Andreprevotia chitinilytica TaxID=396808 RepID=UPI000691F21F|nr:efflux RND transporter periplasmic adaptor subunit [Andreprevotia chitinilytica]
MNLKWMGVCFGVAVAGVGVYLVTHGQPKGGAPANAEVQTPISVTVAEVRQRDLPLSLKAVGRAEAKASVSVKARLDGQVAEVVYAEGQPVHKGQLLLRLDASVLEAQLRQSEALAAKDEAQLERLKGDYRRNATLADQGFISKSALNQTEADLHAAQATLKADRANIDNARLQLSYARVLAPMDGVAGAVLLPAGGAAKANDTTLLVINQVQPIYVTFAVPESQLGRLKQALAAGQVPVSASLPGVDKALTGHLAFVDNAVDTTTGTIMAKAVFGNEAGILTPGQFAQASVQLAQLHNVLVVPSVAVENGTDGSFVFVIKPDSTVDIRPVKTGGDEAGLTVIASGVAAGERVVTSGQSRLRAKSRVVISTASAVSAATGL